MILNGQKVFMIRKRLLLAALAAVLLAVYGAAIIPVFNWRMIQVLKNCYRQVSDIRLGEMDDEDEEVLDDFYSDKIDIFIVDEDENILYPALEEGGSHILEKYFSDPQEQYQEEPVIEIKNHQNFDVIRLKGLLVQDGCSYYVYMRREVSGSEDLVQISCLYFALVFTVFFILSIVLTEKERRSAPLPAGTGQNSGQKIPDESEQSQDRLNAAKKEFVANISHELKTPLAVISGQVEMLQKMGSQIDRDYYYNSIREEIDKMSGMVGNLLDITIMEHQVENMELSEVDLSEMMEYMMLKYEALFRKNGIKIKQDIAGECMVTGNRMYLEEAVNNYLMNAFQRTAQGKGMAVALKKEGTDALIEVSNQGEQIPEEEKDKIWTGYYSGDRMAGTGQQSEKHAGLGLFVVKNIVEQHQGQCGSENLRDGVKFWIRIPLKNTENA